VSLAVRFVGLARRCSSNVESSAPFDHSQARRPVVGSNPKQPVSFIPGQHGNVRETRALSRWPHARRSREGFYDSPWRGLSAIGAGAVHGPAGPTQA
jgi:hypothetical protein